ncbi:MAG: hypothetical protein JST00_17950 [Deltaproteobacteria bacterium]|nr:hypothetical protein [Deltaproteobacteria bacterium]
MTTLTLTRRVGGTDVRHPIDDAAAKLDWRAELPGASTWDRAACSLRILQAEGANAVDLLPLAMPSSWLVNAKASSRAMQRWLARPALERWAALLEALPFELSPEEWLATGPDLREACTSHVAALAAAMPSEGTTLVAVTKVLALLRPQLVPLMDDAALAFALELVPAPESADRPTAGPEAFVPMLDWFAREALASERELVALAAGHTRAVLDGAQVLDRLLWVESWGERLRKR